VLPRISNVEYGLLRSRGLWEQTYVPPADDNTLPARYSMKEITKDGLNISNEVGTKPVHLVGIHRI
jgi:hypothetical protein